MVSSLPLPTTRARPKHHSTTLRRVCIPAEGTGVITKLSQKEDSGWRIPYALTRSSAAASLAGFREGPVLTLICVLFYSSKFSTPHSNGTNKVIDTHGTYLLSFPVYVELQTRQSLLPGLAPVSICHPLPFNFFIIRTEHPARDANPACPACPGPLGEHLGERASRVAPFASRMLLRDEGSS
jgi:hypothetical protein